VVKNSRGRSLLTTHGDDRVQWNAMSMVYIFGIGIALIIMWYLATHQDYEKNLLALRIMAIACIAAAAFGVVWVKSMFASTKSHTSHRESVSNDRKHISSRHTSVP
jgi:hypothetical protein